jgi:hypothetical protein
VDAIEAYVQRGQRGSVHLGSNDVITRVCKVLNSLPDLMPIKIECATQPALQPHSVTSHTATLSK